MKSFYSMQRCGFRPELVLDEGPAFRHRAVAPGPSSALTDEDILDALVRAGDIEELHSCADKLGMSNVLVLRSSASAGGTRTAYIAQCSAMELDGDATLFLIDDQDEGYEEGQHGLVQRFVWLVAAYHESQRPWGAMIMLILAARDAGVAMFIPPPFQIHANIRHEMPLWADLPVEVDVQDLVTFAKTVIAGRLETAWARTALIYTTRWLSAYRGRKTLADLLSAWHIDDPLGSVLPPMAR